MESSHLVVSYLKTPPNTGAGPAPNGASGTGPLGAFGDIIDKIVATVSGQKSGESVAPNGSDTILGAAKTSGTAPLSGNNANTPEGPKLMREFVKELAAIQKAEKAGKPVDPELLNKLKKTVDALAALLGVPQQTPTPITGTAIPDATSPKSGTADATASLPGSTSGAVDKPALSGPTTQLANLAKKAETLATDIGRNQPDLTAKLNALAQKLGSGTLSADNLKTLGLNTNGAPSDPALNSAINALIATKSTPTPAPGPQFADAALHLPDTSTFNSKGANTDTGKTDSSTSTSATSTGAARPDGPANAVVATHGTSDRRPEGDGKSNADTSSSSAGTDTRTAVASTGSTGIKPIDPSALPTSAQATTPPVDGSNAAKVIASAYQPPAANVNLPQMAFQIARHAQGGSNRFEIRLDPADMGKVDVRLDIGASGTVNAHLSVERADTLALLRRDAGALSQALTQAGLDPSKTNLQFSLNQNPFAGQDNAPGGRHASGSGTPLAGTSDPDPAPIITTHYRGTLGASGLNIFV